MQSLEDVANWAGTTGEVHAALMAILGTPTKIRDIGYISRQLWDACIASTTIKTGVDADGNDVTRKLTPVEEGRVEMFRRVALLRLSAPPDHPGATGATVTGPGASPLPQAGGPPLSGQTRKIKLSSVVDPTLDAEIQQLSQAEVGEMYRKYKVKFGDFPSSDVEPTTDQLSGLAQIIKSGNLPYTDFSIFGPHGLRQLRRAVFTSYALNASTGEWSKRESPGPESILQWERCFKTFRVAMLLLEAIDSERLESYLEFIKNQHARFGPEAWGILYRADCRMRQEFHERLRRRLDEAPEHGYTKANPWAAVYAASVRESEFWANEVTTPATLLLARNKSLGAGADSSPERASPSKRKPGASSSAQKKVKGKRTKYTGEDKSQWDDNLKVYSLNRKGIQVCRAFNKGTCGNGRPQSRCAANRSHQCNLCLGPHSAQECKSGKGGKD